MSDEQMQIDYFCARGHRRRLALAVEAEIPEIWDCPRCGLPAGRDPRNPPRVEAVARHVEHLACVRQRRSDEDAERLLGEALERVRRAA